MFHLIGGLLVLATIYAYGYMFWEINTKIQNGIVNSSAKMFGLVIAAVLISFFSHW